MKMPIWLLAVSETMNSVTAVKFQSFNCLVSDVARAVLLGEGHAAKNQCLSLPVRGYVVCR